MTSKQLINQLCYEYSTKNYNEEKLKTTHEIKKKLNLLEEYKKIEDENGIDLITLFKATQQGIWMKRNKVFYFFDNLIIDLKSKCLVQIVSNDEVETFPFDSYGEDWALTREELEDD